MLEERVNSSPVFNIFRRSIDVTRISGGSYVNHRWVGGAETTFSILGSVHPIEGNEVMYLPEGKRDKESYKIVSDTFLRVNGDDPQTYGTSTGDCDRLQLPGGMFEVVGRKPCQNNVINHYVYFVQRISSK
jgi:hypothetical protein